jgi:hypothetical protein
MKSKSLVMLSTLIMALGLMAQTATQTTPAPAGDKAKSCACCNRDKNGAAAEGQMTCCSKDGGCCKDGKCAMESKDGTAGMKCPMMSDDKMACCGKDGGCCKDGKCDMANAKGKSCCEGNKCARPQAGV